MLQIPCIYLSKKDAPILTNRVIIPAMQHNAPCPRLQTEGSS